jgi:ribosomal protein L37AE/L43A
VSVIICSPAEYLRRSIVYCPVCRTKRRFVGREAAWHGTTWHCCGCGDVWADGERQPRPARKGWRAEAIARAKQLWEQAAPFDRAAYERWLYEQLGELSQLAETAE